jgi:transcriptional regulator with GAF, ATPase, and Fis domain
MRENMWTDSPLDGDGRAYDSDRDADQLSGPGRFSTFEQNRFIGCSEAYESIIELICAIASRRCPVIITGETGVGKEMVARQIHVRSNRARRVFVPVDCTTLTGHLFESQLFGHVKGAFTSAVDNTLGFFRAADKGTIFLDEISEIPLELQAKLLRVLQERRVTPLGSTKSHSVDVRVLAATAKDLQAMVKSGDFRADLYYRLDVVRLEVPPLRQRPDDILPLARYFLQSQSAFYDEPQKELSPNAQKLLLDYPWPGNVRELNNVMERAYVLTRDDVIEPAALPFEILITKSRDYPKNDLPTLDEVKRQVVTRTLEYTRGQKLAAAKILGLERRRLNRLIHKLGISIEQIKSNCES